uniref:glutaminase n=1 Tax=Macrostomum lignano TaxID=282301 RepID=A0A1I8JE34_9PLAT
LIEANLSFISRILERELIIPNWTDFCAEIEAMFNACKAVTDGQVATYIPQLARCDPDIWALSVCTVDGQRFSLGSTATNFTMQASQFPLAYAVALNHCQDEFNVHDFVGFEPSGLPYRSMALNCDNKPHNPLIGTGAMVVASLIKPHLPLSDRFDFLISRYKEFAGSEYVGFNNAAFLSERSSSDRNVAIGHILRENKCFPADSSLAETLDFYFQPGKISSLFLKIATCLQRFSINGKRISITVNMLQMCSIETNCESGSLMAATLANSGVCPVTNQCVMSPQSVRSTLSLMSSTGMYDFSGQFAFQVGLPAKSAISGCLQLVVPGVCGFCMYSPALDKLSNLAKAELVNRFNFHNFEGRLKPSSTDKLDPCVKPYEASAHEALTIFYAAFHNDVAALRRAYLRGYSMQLKDYDQRTALHIAASEGHLATVKFLTDVCGLSPREPDRWGFTPLLEAQRFSWPAVEAHLARAVRQDSANSTGASSAVAAEVIGEAADETEGTSQV